MWSGDETAHDFAEISATIQTSLEEEVLISLEEQNIIPANWVNIQTLRETDLLKGVSAVVFVRPLTL